jgi:hypothetical protein
MSRRFLIHVAVCAAFVAAGVAPSSAVARSALVRSTSADTGTPPLYRGEHTRAQFFDGPALAGRKVVWAEQRSPGKWTVHEAPVGGASRPTASTPYHVAALPSASYLNLVASSSRVAIGANVPDCSPSHCPGGSLDRLATWRFGSAPSTVLTCTAAACGSGCAGGSAIWEPALAGEMLAYVDRCTDAIRVRDFSAGRDSRWRDLAAGRRFGMIRGAGRFLAWVETPAATSSRSDLVVYDLAAEQESYRVHDPESGWDLQDDGKVVFLASEGLGWASPAHPSPRWIVRRTAGCPLYPCPPEVAFRNELRIARDRVAIVGQPYEGRARVMIVGLDGAHMAASEIDSRGGDLDFDGRHFISGARPCQTTAISVWDITEPAAPAQARVGCPAAHGASRTASVSRAGWLRLRLHCPATWALGCVGAVHLVAHARGDYTPLATQPYSVPYGRARVISVRLSQHGRRFLARHPGVMIMARTKSKPREWPGASSHIRYSHFAVRRVP